MTLLQKYFKLRKKDPPSYARNTLLLLLFKPFRKYFNVVIIPNIPINLIRIWCYRLIGFNIGKKVFIGMKCYMDDISPHNTIIEDTGQIWFYREVDGIISIRLPVDANALVRTVTDQKESIITLGDGSSIIIEITQVQ